MIKVRRLNNGVRLVMEPITHVQSVSIGIWVKAGAVDENENNSGISHFIEHMMFKGTEARTAKEIAADADRIAGQSNAFTGKEATCYYMKTLSDNIDQGADILIDMFMNSLFAKEEMDRERMVIFEEMKMIEDSPEDDVHDIIMELVFKGDPLSKSIIGTRESLFKVDTAAIKEYMLQNYTTDNVVIAVAGNFDEEHVFSIFDGRFDRLRKGEPKPDIRPQFYVPSFRSKVKEIEQTHLCAAIPTMSRTDDDYPKMQVLNNLFGGSMSSRLFQNIRETKGLAYSVYSMASSFSKTGYFNIYAGISHDKIEQAIDGMKEELVDIRDKGISSDELDIAKAQMLGSYIYGMENTNSRMFNIGKNMILEDRIITQEEVVDEIKAVSEKDVCEMAQLIGDIDNYSAAIISDHEVPIEEYIKR